MVGDNDVTTQLISATVDMRAFNRWAADRGFVRRGAFDEGFALHVLLCSTFGKGVLQPFRLFASARARTGSLYAYADADETALRQMADAFATPDCLAVLDPQRLRSKSMRTQFSEGQQLGFDVRVRPVRRLHSDLSHGGGRVLAKGSEVDVFVVEVARDSAGDANRDVRSAVRREAAYVGWLGERLGSTALIRVESCRLAAFRRTRAVRGDGLGPEGPDATVHGELTVKNPDQFALRVRRGVGRHKAYGYGMVLLRPPVARPQSTQPG